MATEKKLIPTKYHVMTNQLILDEIQNHAFYMFVGDSREDLSSIEQPYDNPRDTFHDAYGDMLFGKRISANTDCKLMIRNIPYEAGQVIDMYDDQDVSLPDRDFWVVVDADAFYHVFKCLDNNLGANSSVTPDFSHISGSNTFFYQTSDGYKWKYMYSISDTDYARFATSEFIPVTPNTTVSNAAVDGAIDNIVIEEPGRGYDCHLDGTFSAGTLRIGGNNRVYSVTNAVASVANNFYTNCMLSIIGGTGVGQHKKIANYFVNATGKYVVTNSAFTTELSSDSQFEIRPTVTVYGQSENTVNVVARALINSSAANSLYRVEIVDRGSGFRTANAYVDVHSVVGVFNEATLRPIISPTGGHGSNAAMELFSRHLSITCKFQNTESNTIPATNGFKQIGLINEPRFRDVLFEVTDKDGTFLSGETVVKISPLLLKTNVTINTTSGTITSNNAMFDQIAANTYLYITNDSGNTHMIGIVNSVASNTSLQLTQNSLFACTEAKVYLANVRCQFVITDLQTPETFLAGNVKPYFEIGDELVGVSSGAKGTINSISRSGVTKDFDTYVQMYKYVGDQLSAAFSNNEMVYQANSADANGLYHSLSEADGVYTMYVSSQQGVFEITNGANTLTGNISGSVLSITDKYLPEIEHGSGLVLYLNNIAKQDRAADQTELVRIIYEFE